ncbi:hypothetical protein [Fimbriiglobus ruber]|uniref:Uncharacterized protein n=1 Tax=Fimbriiglobus ruber TaxID=1908690 RepID=A0A225DH68_9BACT|nr:hypothetical protein [Fimbriiglobus ruber]OWK35437.1 hypothetical protein FRUB_08000 [Fimbriiglobus ruber]
MNSDLNKWLKRLEKKRPFYLYASEEMLYATRATKGEKTIPGWRRRVIWQEGEKTKIGVLADGMWGRYGIQTYGVLTGKEPTGLWQSSGDVVTASELQALLEVANERHSFGEFDPVILMDLEW